jgi:S-adenosylmethionine synthetase
MNVARVRLPGHPDAVCDLVAEAIVDEYTRRDPTTRIRLSVMGGRGALFVSGDVISKADFDVAHLIRRTLGDMGVIAELEPFVSIEPVVAERATLFGAGAESPVAVVGYATQETMEMVPKPLGIAKRIAKALNEKRSMDEDWFWLGPDVEVIVERNASGSHVSLRVEHGAKALSDVRDAMTAFIKSIEPAINVRINELGADDVRGIGQVTGASGKDTAPYGLMIPSGPSGIGLDLARPEKAGAWLARAAARELVKRGAKAALVRALYRPGEREPAGIIARDEKGNDLSKEIFPSHMSLNRVSLEWWRPNLHADAARWGFAGEAGLPWEI